MPPPKPKSGEVATIGAMPPEHRAKGPSVGAAWSSGGGRTPSKHRGKGTGVTPAAATAGTGSTEDLPLTNLSNLVVASPRPRRYLPVVAGPPPRGAGEKKHARDPRFPSLPRARSNTPPRRVSLSGARSNTPSPRGSPLSGLKKNTFPRSSTLCGARSNTPSPRGSSTRIAQLTSSFPSLSINNVDTNTSPSPEAHLGDSAACSCRESATSHRTVKKSGRGASVGEVRLRPRLTPKAGAGLSGGDAPQRPGLTAKTCVSLNGGDVQPRPCLVAKIGAGFSGGDVQQRPLLIMKTGADSSLDTTQKHQAATGPIGKMPQKKPAMTGSNGDKIRKKHAVGNSNGEIQKERRVEKSAPGLNGPTQQKKHAGIGLKGDTQKQHHVTKSGQGLNGQMLQKNHAVTCFNGETPQKKHKHAATGSTVKTQKEHSIKKCGRSSGEMLQKKNRKMKTVQCKELSADEKRQLEEERVKDVHEAEQAIQQLNKSGLGESISYQEFEMYLEQLPSTPPFDDSIQPGYDQLNELQIRHIMYRIKYCKFIQQKRNNGEIYNAEFEDDHPLYLLVDKLECLEEDVTELKGSHLRHYLHKEVLLREIEDDEIFDWSFLRTVAGLDDYQRLVPQNYGDCGYENWIIYRGYFHSYEVELEYLMYWEELLKSLKWMEDYVLMDRPSLTWGKICTRGCYQAIKIASRFSKITECVARIAYYECIETMCLDIYWYKELDGVYFEIWQRINNLKMSFRDALDSVYQLNKFPLQHHKIKNALDDDHWSDMEKEFRICTTDINGEMTEGIAREFIAEAIRSQRERPKFYAQYIKKKIEIAKILGVIPRELQFAEKQVCDALVQ